MAAAQGHSAQEWACAQHSHRREVLPVLLLLRIDDHCPSSVRDFRERKCAVFLYKLTERSEDLTPCKGEQVNYLQLKCV